MKKVLLAAAAFAAMGVVPAIAADLGRPAPVYKTPPVVTAAYDWTGFYAGANIGYGWAVDSMVLTSDPTLVAPGFITQLANTAISKPAGVVGGGQFGYNWQMGNALLGVEGDISGASLSSTTPAFGDVEVGSFVFRHFVHSHESMDWLATVRGRLGFLPTQQFLLYGTGGLAVGQVKTDSSLTNTVPNNVPACIAANFARNLKPPEVLCMGSSDSANRVGWTVGAGAEYALGGNWSLKAEYLYVDLGKSSSTGFDTRSAPPLPLFANTKDDFNIVRFGFNYRFGGAVAAKY